MATHVIRPGVWAKQVEFLYPTLRRGDKLYVATAEQKAAIDILFLTWGLPHRVEVVLPELDPEIELCARCLRGLTSGFGNNNGRCQCELHKQTCPKLWLDIAEASLQLVHDRRSNYVRRIVDTRGVTVHTADAPCNCGCDKLLAKLQKGDTDDSD